MKKKVFAMVLVLVILSTLLVGCKKKTECDFCGEVARCDTIKFWGEECDICGNCLDEWNELFG